MAEGFITRRGGVSSEQALAPTITFVSKTDTQIVFTIKNNDTSTAVILWELDDATPDANSLELAADTTSSNITVTGLDDDTEFIVYATANVTGKVKSNVSQLSITTDVAPTFISATGGTTLEYNQSGKRYKSHTFTSSGNFVVNSLSNQGATFNQVDYLIIAGGASGGGATAGLNFGAGGGGAGGYRTTITPVPSNQTPNEKVVVNATSYSITIGAGGSSTSASANQGNNGSNSSALGITSTGGGGGGRGGDASSLNSGASGGSGGGGGRFNGTGGTGTLSQGRNGGNTDGNTTGGGGGGGAGDVGGVALEQNVGAASDVAGDGGNGLTNLLRTGSNETRAGGGGGGVRSSSSSDFIRSFGGDGGGGRGAAPGNASTSGTVNTGGGGGGASGPGLRVGAAGGSGIVIIRYEIAPSA